MRIFKRQQVTLPGVSPLSHQPCLLRDTERLLQGPGDQGGPLSLALGRLRFTSQRSFGPGAGGPERGTQSGQALTQAPLCGKCPPTPGCTSAGSLPTAGGQGHCLWPWTLGTDRRPLLLCPQCAGRCWGRGHNQLSLPSWEPERCRSGIIGVLPRRGWGDL